MQRVTGGDGGHLRSPRRTRRTTRLRQRQRRWKHPQGEALEHPPRSQREPAPAQLDELAQVCFGERPRSRQRAKPWASRDQPDRGNGDEPHAVCRSTDPPGDEGQPSNTEYAYGCPPTQPGPVVHSASLDSSRRCMCRSSEARFRAHAPCRSCEPSSPTRAGTCGAGAALGPRQATPPARGATARSRASF